MWKQKYLCQKIALCKPLTKSKLIALNNQTLKKLKRQPFGCRFSFFTPLFYAAILRTVILHAFLHAGIFAANALKARLKGNRVGLL